MNTIALYMARELPKIEACLRTHIDQLSPYVRPTAQHVLKAGGKRLRPLLTILVARALGYKGKDIYPLACSLELLHSATLIHDDVLDGADTRRGQPAAHTVFGVTHSILTGDVLLALANTMMSSYGIPSITACLSDAILKTVSGEIIEIARIRDVDMDMDGYLEIITGKTAYLIKAACQVGAQLAGAPAHLEEAACGYGLNIGVAFQLVDDALDYTSPKEVMGKPKGADIREGKLTLPLILYMRDLPQDDRLAFTKAFKENTLTESEMDRIVADVAAQGHAQRTREMAQTYLEAAGSQLALFPDSTETKHLRAAMEGMAKRDK